MPYIGNQHIVGDHINNFKVLDDISSYTETFNGASTNVVSTSDDTIRIPEHRFIHGQRVTYTNGGGGNIGGLTSGQIYFITFHTKNTIKLATNLQNANNNVVVNFSSVGSGTSHTINAAFDGVNTKFKITYEGGKEGRFNNATQLNIAINNVIQRPNLNPITFTEGFAIEDHHKIIFKVAPTVNDIFWGSIIANTIENFDLRDNEVDNFTGDGSATEFTLSTIPANNESVIVTIDGVLQHPSDKNVSRAYTLIDSVIQFTAAPALNAEIQVRHIGFAGASTADVSGFYGRTGNVTLTANDHITTGDITSRNINASGIVTASTFDGAFTGNVVGTSATFTGNLTVGGVLTYEDVTNVDSVGIITAQKDIHVGAGVSAVGVGTFGGLVSSDLTVEKSGNLSVNIKSTGGYGALEVGGTSSGYVDIKKPFSADFDLRLMHDGNNSYITSADKPLHFDAYSYKGINIGALGQTDLRYAGNVKLKTETGGVSVTGILTATSLDVSTDLDVDGHTNLDNVSIAGVITATTFSGSGASLTGITNANISDSASIVGTKIANASINANDKLENSSITESKLGSGVVSSSKIANGTIVNEDINASAAIAGTKIAPAFGTQNITTSGTINSGDISVAGTAPTISLTDINANDDFEIKVDGGKFEINDTTNTANRFKINSSGTVIVGGNLDVGAGLDVTGNVGATGTLSTTGSELVIAGAEPRLTFIDTDNNPDFQIWANAQKFAIYDSTNSATRLHINSSGKIGINTVSPGRMMHIFSGTSGHPLILERGDTSNTQVELRTAGATRGYWGCSTTANFMVYDNDASDIQFVVNQTGAIGLSGANYGSSGQVLTSQGSGSAVTWSTISGTTINNNANNRVITGSGTANTLEAESNLTFTGSNLTVTNSSGASELTLTTPNNTDGGVYFRTGSTNAGAVTYLHTDNSMKFRVNSTNKMIIDSSGDFIFSNNGGDNRIERNTTSGGPYLLFHNRGTNTTDSSGVYNLGGISAAGYRDVANPGIVGSMQFVRQPTAGGASSGCDIIFRTGFNGTTSHTGVSERLRINFQGAISSAVTRQAVSYTALATPTYWTLSATGTSNQTLDVSSVFGVPDNAKAILVQGWYHITGYSQGAAGQGDHASSHFSEYQPSGGAPWSFTTSSTTTWGQYVMDHDGDASGPSGGNPNPHHYGVWTGQGIVNVNPNGNIYGRCFWGYSGGTHYNQLWCFGYYM